jgi:hypothetical protein
MPRKLRNSFVRPPIAILSLRISGEGVFQQPRDLSTIVTTKNRRLHVVGNNRNQLPHVSRRTPKRASQLRDTKTPQLVSDVFANHLALAVHSVGLKRLPRNMSLIFNREPPPGTEPTIIPDGSIPLGQPRCKGD